jgi:hypothetical protein
MTTGDTRVDILLTWRCSVPERSAQLFLVDFGEDAVASHRRETDATNRLFSVGFDEGPHDIVIEAARAFLIRNSTKLRQLIDLGGSSQFDFALLAGAEDSFASSMVFEPGFLAELVRHRVQLCVSAYPVSEETE